MAEAKAAGWGIELTQRYFAGAVAPAENYGGRTDTGRFCHKAWR